ncbi:MAG TPA: type II toxin-antitoxin system VapB family antitoxin [Lacunisphaera sp.]|jgi:Arc/MetJ family transcription regulator|nr:type II toxin-antitoxin system VapB family antitoxin [Lacunisphaera sp.]
MAYQPYRADVMKMTMHIDEDVLNRVMQVTGAATKREAVEIALSEMARRHKLKELLSQGLGLTPEQLKAEFAPTPADQFDRPLPQVAEAKSPYGQPGATGQ